MKKEHLLGRHGSEGSTREDLQEKSRRSSVKRGKLRDGGQNVRGRGRKRADPVE